MALPPNTISLELGLQHASTYLGRHKHTVHNNVAIAFPCLFSLAFSDCSQFLDHGNFLHLALAFLGEEARLVLLSLINYNYVFSVSILLNNNLSAFMHFFQNYIN